jgi:uncharacterized protein (UPF0332 family)
VTFNATDSIRYRIRRANDTLVEADAMAQIGHWNACVNRLYYACFYAATALLLQRNLLTSKHTQVRSLLNRHFVRPGLMAPELGSLYNRLFDNRHEGDYADFIEFQEAQVRPWIDQARDFVAHVERLLADQPPGNHV